VPFGGGLLLDNDTDTGQDVLMIAGIFARLLRLLGLGSGGGSREGTFTVHRSETFQVRDPTSGRVTHYNDRSQMPKAMRDALEKAELPGQTGSQVRTETHREYRLVGPDGEFHIYKSLDEMPPEMRAMFGRKF
jgi:hypothetical protein